MPAGTAGWTTGGWGERTRGQHLSRDPRFADRRDEESIEILYKSAPPHERAAAIIDDGGDGGGHFAPAAVFTALDDEFKDIARRYRDEE